MEECECSIVQVDYQTEELYIVTIVFKYWKRGSNNNNNVLCILLSDTTQLKLHGISCGIKKLFSAE